MGLLKRKLVTESNRKAVKFKEDCFLSRTVEMQILILIS